MSTSAMDTLKGLLGDNADEKIKMALGALSAQNSNNSASANEEPAENISNTPLPSTPILDSGTMDSLLQIKNIVDNFTNSNNDSRANLLMSLKPYMRTSRQSSIDAAIRLLNISKLSGIFKLR